MSYIFQEVTGTDGSLSFQFNGQFALKNYNVEIVNGNRLKVVSATNEMFSLLEAEVSEVEINGQIYSDANAAQLALQTLVYSNSTPVVLTEEKYLQLAAAVQAADRGKILPDSPVPSGGWQTGWYTAGLATSVDPGTNYPNQNNLKAKKGFITKFFYNGTLWDIVEYEIPQASKSLRNFEDIPSGNFPLQNTSTDKVQVIKDNSIWQLKDGTTANLSDVPSKDSLIWDNIGGGMSDDLSNLILINKSFLNGELVEELIPMPHAGETANQYITPAYQVGTAAGYGWGYIQMSELANFDKLRLVGAEGSAPLFLAKQAGGGTTNLMEGDANQDFEIDIDHNALQYIYTRSPNMKFYKTKLDGVPKTDAIKLYIDDKVKVRKSECVFYPEDYGAQVLDPRNPDTGKDCTDAFNNMFGDMFTNYPTINSYRVVMAGVYRIGGAPVYNNGQINIPFAENIDWNFKSVYFEGLTRPSFTDRGANNTLNPLLGSGFYSSFIYTGSGYRHVIRIGEGTNFGLRVGHVFMDNIACYIKTHGSNNESIANNMSGFDFSRLSTFAFTDIYSITTSAGLNTLKPATSAIGLLMPKVNNMASLYGNSLKVMGFGVGTVLPEHLNLNHLIAVFNIDGVQIENTYPINVGNATLEHNLCHVRLYPNSAVNFGVLQTEDINDAQYWFNRTDNMIKGSATSRITISQTMSHLWGGGAVPLTYDPAIKLRYLMDEFGNSKLN